MSAGTADGEWTDLAGTEVRQRLEHRGWPPEHAGLLYRAYLRGDPEATRQISEALAR